jgi:hypothetical protein
VRALFKAHAPLEACAEQEAGMAEVICPNEGQRFYAVARGRQPGIYTSWAEASRQVLGFSGNVHQAFHDRALAELFIQNYELYHGEQ